MIQAVFHDCKEKMDKKDVFPFSYKHNTTKICKRCRKSFPGDINTQEIVSLPFSLGLDKEDILSLFL